MDVNTALALVSAAAGSAATEAGRQAWQSLLGLARRVTGRSAGEPEDLPVDPGDEEGVRVLTGRIADRARDDAGFAAELCRWAEAHRPALQQSSVHNTVSGNAHVQGPVIQAHTINGGINFGG